MATYGIYGNTSPAPVKKKPLASDVLTGTANPAAVAQGAQPTQATPATGAPPPNPFGAPTGSNLFGPVAPAANPGSFESLLNKATPARAQNVGQAQQTISQQLMPSPGPSRESASARSAFIKAQDEASRKSQEASALGGRVLTGQIAGDTTNFNRESLTQRADLENKLAISDAARNDQRQQQGMSNLLSLEGLGESSRNATAQNALAARGQDITMRGQDIQATQAEKALSENARQFNTEKDFKTWATKEGWTQDAIARAWQSSENQQNRAVTVSENAQDRALKSSQFADTMGLEKSKLAETARQFNTEQDFKTWATKEGWTQDAIARAWQSGENQKGRSFTASESALDRAVNVSQFAEKLGLDKSQFAEQIRQFNTKSDFDKWAFQKGIDQENAKLLWQANESDKSRAFTASESALDRALNSSQFAEKIGMDKQQFAENVRQFNSKEDFDKWATNKGFDQQDKELVWKSNEADVQRKFETGERMSSQDHQINLTRLQGQIQQDNEQFNHVLNLDTMDKQAAIDKESAATLNSYQVARDNAAMTHDQAMEAFKAELTGKLQAAGYDHETAMQAAELKAKAFQSAQDREQNTKLAQAELTYKYQALSDQTGISRQEINLKKQEVANSLSLGLQQLGLDQKKVDAAIKSQDFQDRMGVMSTFIEMAGDNPDAMDFAAQQFMSLLSDPKLPGGAMITPEQKAAGLAAMGRKPTEESKPGSWSTDNSISDTVKGTENLSKGNVVTGIKQTLAGTVGTPVSVAKDVTHATANGVRKVSKWLGF